MAAGLAWADERLIKAEARTLIWSEPLPDGGRAVVKLYRRRGVLEPLRRVFVPHRVEREFELLMKLHAGHVPCSEPLRWGRGWSARHGRHEALATREIPGATPLKVVLRRARAGGFDLAPLFSLARRMHDCGVSHGAFYPANVLVSTPHSGSPVFHLVDLAHACEFARSIVGTRPADFDLLDMLRAIERDAPIDDRARWLEGYGTGAAHVSKLLGMLDSHRIERPWRHLHRAETDVRAAWDRLVSTRSSSPRAASRASP